MVKKLIEVALPLEKINADVNAVNIETKEGLDALK